MNVATRKRIIILTLLGYTIDAIHKRLEEEKIYTNARSIQHFLAKFRVFHTISDLKRKPRHRFLTPEMLDQLENLLQSNDELTARKLRDKLCINYGDNDVIPSISTIKRFEIKKIMTLKITEYFHRYRKQLGWSGTRPHYCQLIREANKAKRKKWYEILIQNKEKFENVIFSDECTVQLDNHGKPCFRKKNEPCTLKQHPKHPVKAHL